MPAAHLEGLEAPVRQASQVSEVCHGTEGSFKHRKVKLELPRNLQDQYMGPFKVLKRVGPCAYKLGLSHSPTLRTIHLGFHVSLLRDFEDNGLR